MSNPLRAIRRKIIRNLNRNGLKQIQKKYRNEAHRQIQKQTTPAHPFNYPDRPSYND